VFDPEVIAAMLGGRTMHELVGRLSQREREVLEGMAEGDSNRAIAERLCMTEPVVEAHVASIFDELDLPPISDNRRRRLVMRALLHA